MSIKKFHYNFKRKLNKIDSQQKPNLEIPEIDMILNEAQLLFVKMIAEPRFSKYLGFERNQRSIDDIRTLVVPYTEYNVNSNNILEIPDNYLFYVDSYAYLTKGECKEEKNTVDIRQHDDDFESDFYKSSFIWRKINATFNRDGIQFYPENDTQIDSIYMTYIKQPVYVHNAEDFSSSGYRSLDDGQLLTGFQDSELPVNTHDEIVDLAVLIATGEIQASDYQIKMAKLNLNKIS